jgi:succinyl-CoA synthetase beta subunit
LKLFEYEAKTILKEQGVETPKGFLAKTSREVGEVAGRFVCPLVVKSQVLLSGRGRAGGILFASSVEEAEEAAERLLDSEVKGVPVKRVLVEERVQVKEELYFGVTVDRFSRSYVVVSSSTGGVDIEDVALQFPEKVLRMGIEPGLGFRPFHARRIAEQMGYSGRQLLELARILETVSRLAVDCDSVLFEVNPLVETVTGKFVAIDAHIEIDDNALFRHPEFEKRLFEDVRKVSSLEIQALRNGIDYVKLDGNIGVVGNGAGLVMATLDMLNYYGGRPANFLDLGGGAAVERTKVALEIVLSDPDVDVVFVNILGGITHCDEVARAVVEVMGAIDAKKQLVIRLVGTNEEEGKRVLRNKGLMVFESMEVAAERVVEIGRKGVNTIGHNG